MAQPRAQGQLALESKARGPASAIAHLRSAGCMKALFPRHKNRLEAIVINTAGGLTGGDRIALEATAGAGSHLALTTQAAERGYRAASGHASVDTCLRVDADARLDWLPQELILYEGAALHRTLRIDLEARARLLMVEPVVFGRAAMGEVLGQVDFRDRIGIYREGAPLYLDGVNLTGDVATQLQLQAQGCGAMASVVYAAPDAEAHLAPLRSMLPETSGVSLLQGDLLAVRLLALDSFELRRVLLPVLDRLSGDTLPTSWRL